MPCRTCQILTDEGIDVAGIDFNRDLECFWLKNENTFPEEIFIFFYWSKFDIFSLMQLISSLQKEIAKT